jgi:hypothetical protein
MSFFSYSVDLFLIAKLHNRISSFHIGGTTETAQRITGSGHGLRDISSDWLQSSVILELSLFFS